MSIPRTKIRQNEITGVSSEPTVPIPIAQDNLVCACCGVDLNAVAWAIVSAPKRKGIVVFACIEHAQEAMALIDKALA